MVKVSTSILSIKDSFENNIENVINSNTDYIHLDIMDGIFVKNKSFNYNEIKKLFYTNKKIDIHFMVDDIIQYIEQYKDLNPEYITVHFENKNLIDGIRLIKKSGIKAGIAVNPTTPIENIYNILEQVDMVLIMSVEPGYGGQKFINNSTDKIIKLKKYITENDLNIVISVDGGINNETSKLVIGAGVDIIVSGSYITNSNDYNAQIVKLLKK